MFADEILHTQFCFRLSRLHCQCSIEKAFECNEENARKYTELEITRTILYFFCDVRKKIPKRKWKNKNKTLTEKSHTAYDKRHGTQQNRTTFRLAQSLNEDQRAVLVLSDGQERTSFSPILIFNFLFPLRARIENYMFRNLYTERTKKGEPFDVCCAPRRHPLSLRLSFSICSFLPIYLYLHTCIMCI